MKTKEFDTIIDGVLEEETRKLIEEQIEGTDQLVNSVKSFQSLSGLLEKIVEIKNNGTDTIVIGINGVTPEELVQCCGGDSLGKVQTNLMQGLHHDLKDNGFSGDYDIDINTQGDSGALNLMIQITPNDDEFSKETDMKEVTDNGELTNTFGQSMYEEEPKDTNPDADPDKEVILGDKEVNESTKKTITLNQGEMGDLLGKIIKEAVESPNITVPANGIPGIDITKKNHSDSGKENNKALEAVEKKIKDYLSSIVGNDDPEFPNQIGQGEEKVSAPVTDSQDEEIEMNRGRNPADLTYDNEPGETFKKRAKLSLVGAAEMGNSQEYANVIPSKVGENIAKAAEKRKDIRKDEPIYDKEAVPVKEDDKKPVRPAVDEPAVASDIKRMKQMTGYKEKTQ